MLEKIEFFITNNVLNRCYLLQIPRPKREHVAAGIGISKATFSRDRMKSLYDQLDPELITNHKELFSFALVQKVDDLPKDNFNIICDKIIYEMEHADTMSVALFRDNIYDILIYNLDAFECIWYVFSYFVQNQRFEPNERVTEFMKQMFVFFKQYGNNYRAIFHLEHVLFAMMCALKGTHGSLQNPS